MGISLERSMGLAALLVVVLACVVGSVGRAAEVQVMRGTTGVPCILIISGPHFAEGGCELRPVSNGEITLSMLGTPVAHCRFRFDSYTTEDGTGMSSEQFLRGPRCPIRPCLEAGTKFKTTWTHRTRVVGPREAVFDTRLCAETTGTPKLRLECSVPLRALHAKERYYRLEAHGAQCGDSGVEFDGSWRTNANARIEARPAKS